MRRLLMTVALSAALLLGSSTVLADPTVDAETNAARAAYGLAPLTTSAALTSLAGTRAQQITVNFAHPSSWQWLFDAIPGCESVIGENIAWHTAPVPAGWPVSAWMNSPDHRANILGGFTHQGSALLATNGRVYAVQLFAKTCGVAPAPAPPVVDEIPDTSMSPAN